MPESAQAVVAGLQWTPPKGWRRFVTHDLILAIIAAIFAAYVFESGTLYLQGVVINSITFMVLAYSWNVISGLTGYFSFGQVAWYGIGGYALALMMTKSSVSYPLALVLAVVACMIISVPVGWVLLRLRGIYFALGTLALYVALGLVATNSGWVGAGQGLTVPVTADSDTILLVAIVAGAITIVVALWLGRSRLGLRAQAMAADEDAIKVLGVQTMGVKLSMFAIAAGLGGLAGAVATLNAGFLTPDTAFSDSVNLQAIVYALIGGVGTVWGPLIGTAVVQTVVTRFGTDAATEVQIALGLLIILVVTFTPGGIVGLLNRVGVLRRRIMLRPRRAHGLSLAPGWLRRHGDGPPRPGAPLLECAGVTVQFSGVTAVDGVDLTVASGQFLAMIGANGAGKTTLFNAMSGYVRRAGGSVRLGGQDVSTLNTTQLARAGLSRTFQIPRLAENLTVWENVLVGSLLDSGLAEAQDRAALIIAEIGLGEVANEPVEQLGPGTRRRVEIARVVATRPRVILLDEALAGMSSEEIEEVRHAIGALRDWGVEGIVSVEHVLSAVRDLADQMLALDFGKKVAEGRPDDVLAHEAVVTSYLGGAAGPGDAAADHAAEQILRNRPARQVGETVLDAAGLTAGYGKIRVLWDVGVDVAPGEFIGVLGASGAGKTTLCRALTGGCTVHEGKVVFAGTEITGQAPHLIARRGAGYVPSSRELFGDLSVEDNLRLGAVAWSGSKTDELMAHVLELFPEIEALLGRHAKALSGGQQQMVAIGRALMREPRLLILDEPSTGLAPVVVSRLMQGLRALAGEGVAILVVEQNAVETLRAVDRAYVLQEGRIVFSGTAAELRDDPRLARAYLGADASGPAARRLPTAVRT